MLNRFSSRAALRQRAANFFILTSIAAASLVVGGCVDRLQTGSEPGAGGGGESSTGTGGSPESTSNATGTGGSTEGTGGSTEGTGGSTEGTGGGETGDGGGGGGTADPELSGHTFGGGDTFNACTVTSGDPDGLKLVCHYPGPDTCVLTETKSSRCLDCDYPDGSGRGHCVLDPSAPLPDPLSGRPANLPPPGECVTKQEGGGVKSCTTCTHDDGSATKTCTTQFDGTCDFLPREDTHDPRSCVVCLGREAVLFCDPAY